MAKIFNCAGDFIRENKQIILELDDDEGIVCTKSFDGKRKIFLLSSKSVPGLLRVLSNDPIGPVYDVPFERL